MGIGIIIMGLVFAGVSIWLVVVAQKFEEKTGFDTPDPIKYTLMFCCFGGIIAAVVGLLIATWK